MNKPLVSICCNTFNQEKYIGSALDGFLMQKTTFPIEVIVHDDASTDGTAAIVSDYAKKYPHLIFPILQRENQLSKGVKPLLHYDLPRARGKYLALCEGDDYWTDPHKLQKQVDFLEANADYGLSHTDVKICRQKQSDLTDPRDNVKNLAEPGTDLKERILLSTYIIRTPTVVMRRKLLLDLLDQDPFLFHSDYFRMGDTPLWVELANVSKLHYLPEATAVYRMHGGSATRQTNVTKQMRFMLSMFDLRMYFDRKYRFSEAYSQTIRRKYQQVLFDYQVLHPDYEPLHPSENGHGGIRQTMVRSRAGLVAYRRYVLVYYRFLPALQAVYRKLRR
ncbi:MAG: glycosyltransferase [Prolixibacteraceae bacterium]